MVRLDPTMPGRYCAVLLLAIATTWQGPGNISVRAGVYSEAQAARGEKIYAQRCGACHQPAQFTAPTFLQSWQGRTADALFDQIRTTMPQENPGGMKRQEYVDVLAFLFRENGLPAGERELEPTDEALTRVLIEPPAASRPKGDE